MENFRNYHCTDPVLLTLAEGYVTLVEKYGEELAGLNAKFTPEYFQFYKDLIKAVRQIPSDQLIVDIQTEKTDAAENARKRTIELYRKLRYYIEEAFPNKKLIWNQLGANDLNDSRYSEDKMIRFMLDLLQGINLHKESLLAVSCPQAFLDEIKEATDDLVEKNNDKKMYMKNRRILTYNRIDKFNEIWEIIRSVYKAAQIVFEDKPNVLHLFELPAESKGKTKEEPEDALEETQIELED